MAKSSKSGSRAKGWSPGTPTTKPATGGQKGLPKPAGKGGSKNG
jgi:hypothetical protein